MQRLGLGQQALLAAQPRPQHHLPVQRRGEITTHLGHAGYRVGLGNPCRMGTRLPGRQQAQREQIAFRAGGQQTTFGLRIHAQPPRIAHRCRHRVACPCRLVELGVGGLLIAGPLRAIGEAVLVEPAPLLRVTATEGVLGDIQALPRAGEIGEGMRRSGRGGRRRFNRRRGRLYGRFRRLPCPARRLRTRRRPPNAGGSDHRHHQHRHCNPHRLLQRLVPVCNRSSGAGL